MRPDQNPEVTWVRWTSQMPLPRLPNVGFAWRACHPFSPSTFTPIKECCQMLLPKKFKHLHSNNKNVVKCQRSSSTFTPPRLPPLAMAAAILARPWHWTFLFRFYIFCLFTSRWTISIDAAVLTKPYYILWRVQNWIFCCPINSFFCLIVECSNALAEVLFFVRWFEAGHHLAEVVEECAELEKVQVNSTAKRFWQKAVAKEETQSNLKEKIQIQIQTQRKRQRQIQRQKNQLRVLPKRNPSPTSPVGA